MKNRQPVPVLVMALCVVCASLSSLATRPVVAQSAVLAEVYGRGVHAYHSNRYAEAYEFLSMAIGAGLKDPSAYYFRGLAAHSSGRSYEAEADWQMGADLEAQGGNADAIGRSLVRVQGPLRLQLETIREKSRLQALAEGISRSKIRYGELGAGPVAIPRPGTPRPSNRPRGVVPPPAPANDNPFADDLGGDPMVESNDAFAEAGKGPLAQPKQSAKPAADAKPAAGNDPFGTPAAADPFAAPAGNDPFGTPAANDPFGASPF